MKLSKWKVEELNNKAKFSDASKIILSKKINSLLALIKKYLENNSEENLHQVRIGIRRLRYSFEVFSNFLNSKLANKFYVYVEELQDFTGLGRDLDVMMKYINNNFSNTKLSKDIINKIKDEKNHLNEKLKIELMKFYHSNSLKKIIKQLSNNKQGS